MSSGCLNNNLYKPPCSISKLFLFAYILAEEIPPPGHEGINYIYKGRDDFKDVLGSNLKLIIHFS